MDNKKPCSPAFKADTTWFKTNVSIAACSVKKYKNNMTVQSCYLSFYTKYKQIM